MFHDLASFRACIFVKLVGFDCILGHHPNFRVGVKSFQEWVCKIWNKREDVQGKACAVLLNWVVSQRYRKREFGPWSCQFSYYPQSILFDWKEFTGATGGLKYLMCFYIICGIFAQKPELLHLLPTKPCALQHAAERGALIFLNTILSLEYSSFMLSVWV